jgi:leucyl-tRNA synthetase
MHLIYARFFTKALRDLGYLKIDEPFVKLFNQGMIHGEDGAVMSKSRGNVVDPMEMIEKYGADSLRIFLVSIASPDKDFQWDSAGLESYFKFLNKVWAFFRDYKPGKTNEKMESKINSVIKSVTIDIENLRYNSAVVSLKLLFEFFELNKENVSKANAELFLKMLNVFCPHIAQEIWFTLGNKGLLAEEKWPEADESKINKAFEEAEKVLEKTIGDIQNILKMLSEKEEKIEKVYLYVLPKEIEIYDKKIIERRIGKKVEVFAVNDKSKYDPEGKSAKAKPNKPGIYVE